MRTPRRPRPSSAKRVHSRGPCHGARFEQLELRHLLATFVDLFDPMPDGGGCGSSTNPCNTIQAGVDAAPAGSQVHISTGLYGENVTLSKSLTLSGDPAGVTIIPPSGVDGMDITGSVDVVLESLTVTSGKIGIFASGLSSLECVTST